MKKALTIIILSSLVLSTLGCSSSNSLSSDNVTTVISDTKENVDSINDANAGEEISATDSEAENELIEEAEKSNSLTTGINILPDGDFDYENSKWGLYTESGGSASTSISSSKLKAKIMNPGNKNHSVQVYCDGFEVLQGAKYVFSFDIESTVPRTFEWAIQVNGGDYHPYAGQKDVKLPNEVTHIEYEFTMNEGSDPAPRLVFNIGGKNNDTTGEELTEHEIYLDNVSLIMTDAQNAQAVELINNEVNINLNQIGFLPESEKRATLRDAGLDSSFDIVDTESGEVVYSGTFTEAPSKGSSEEKVSYGYFTDFTRPGTYKIIGNKGDESYPFAIGKDIYEEALRASLKMLYLQRCGSELPKEYAGDFSHDACHTQIAKIYGSDETIDVSGGWHDAGDYGRYVVPAAKTIADLLLSYENYPEVFDNNNNIPESGNGIPDILDEARYELEWLFKMQDTDGGVYHKVTGLAFEDVVMPDTITSDLYVLTKSKTATADFAAAMFLAARVYKDFDEDFSDKCLESAYKAIPYFEEHISERNYINPKDVLTGEYSDTNSSDEYFWFLCEGYKTTGDEGLAKKISDFNFDKLEDLDGLGWATVTEYAYYAYLTSKDLVDTGNFDVMAEFLEYVEEASEASKVDSYGSSLLSEYPWGSNMTICNNGIGMLMASELLGSKNDSEVLLSSAARQLNYILGENTTSYCFLTGFGTNSPQNPHHRESQYLEKAMPGMIVGGPNSNLEDPYAKTVLKDLPYAHRYADNAQTYSCNEVTIYWNSPFVYLLAGLIDN